MNKQDLISITRYLDANPNLRAMKRKDPEQFKELLAKGIGKPLSFIETHFQQISRL